MTVDRQPALAILRVSPRPRDRDVWSEDIQREGVQALADRRGYEIVREVVAHMTSGADPERSTRRVALEMAQRGEIKAVLVYTLSRFSRESALFAVSDVGALARLGVVVWSHKDTELDPTSDMYDVLLVLKARQAAAERESIVSNTREGLRKAREAGVHLGRVPWGWRRIGEVRKGAARTAAEAGIEPDEGGEADRLREAYRLRAQGMSLYRLSILMRRDEESLRSALRQERNRAVVGDALWEAAQVVKRAPRSGGGRPYLFAGLLRCPTCGRLMAGRMTWGGPRSPHKRPWYGCRRYHVPHPRREIREVVIAGAVSAVLARAVLPAEARSRVVARLSGTQSTSVAAERARRLEELADRRRRLQDMAEAGALSVDELRGRLARIEEERAALPPEPVAPARIRRDLSVLDSLPRLVSQALAHPDNRELVNRANAVLRRIVGIKLTAAFAPTVSLRTPFDVILAAAEGPELTVIDGTG